MTGPGGATPLLCPRCGMPPGLDHFCAHCGVLNAAPRSEVVAATRGRRLGGYLLENVLQIVTLGVGWLIWLYFAARHGQTPAKQLLDMVILHENGAVASAQRIWVREILVKGLGFGWVGMVATGGIATLLAYAWVLWDRDRQALYDKVTETLVVYTPAGLPGLAARGPARTADAASAPPPHAPSIGEGYTGSEAARRLEELETLRREGLITERQYHERRRRILDEN